MKKKIGLGIILGCFGIGLFIVLTLIRIPWTGVVVHTVNRALNDRALFSVEKVGLGLPDRLRLKGAVIEIPGKASSIQEQVTEAVLRPDYRRLIRGYLPARFTGELSAGRVQGRFGLSRDVGMRDAYLDVHTERLELARLQGMASALGRKVEGTLSGELQFQGNLEDVVQTQGSGHITIIDGAVETKVGFPGLDTIPFERVEVLFSVKDGLVQLEEADMQGPVFTGSLSGTVELRQRLSRSRLSVQGTLTPGPEIRENPFLGRLLGRAMQGERTIPIQVRGTLERPSIVRSKP